jgi:hypothetical protein
MSESRHDRSTCRFPDHDTTKRRRLSFCEPLIYSNDRTIKSPSLVTLPNTVRNDQGGQVVYFRFYLGSTIDKRIEQVLVSVRDELAAVKVVGSNGDLGGIEKGSG